MKIDILSIFPEMFAPILNESIIKRAQEKGIVRIEIHNLRDFTSDKHNKVDDRPFGGGPGMLLKPEPLFEAVEAILKNRRSFRLRRIVRRSSKEKIRNTPRENRRFSGTESSEFLRNSRGNDKPKIILLSPQGKKLTQNLCGKFSKFEHLILICGRYEGVDERVRQFLISDELSIGDYVLSGGELPAMVLVDSIVRLIPGVLGNEDSRKQESFSENLLDYPQYTRPALYRGMEIPEILLSGKHRQIQQWRQKESLKRTVKLRPDLRKS